MYPIELIESRLGELSERAFQAAAPARGGSDQVDEDAARQQALKLVDDGHDDRVSADQIAALIEAGLVEESSGGHLLTPIGRYTLRADAAPA